MYRLAIRFTLFLLPPELAHNIGLSLVRLFGFFYRVLINPLNLNNKRGFISTPFGFLKSPVGLAAGLDKNAKALWGWEALGFSFVEIGTVTPRSQKGNNKPRLFRHIKIKALVNRMGFNNDGAQIISSRLRKARAQGLKIKVGGNIGKNFLTNMEDAPRDYGLCAQALADVVDYLVINVSSPNTPGLRGLQSEENLRAIVTEVQKGAPHKPLFIKVSPDQFNDFIEGVEKIAREFKIDGLICGNTVANHNLQQGGLSGGPVFSTNLELCQVYASRNPDLFIIGVGGIFNAKQGQTYLDQGAKLIQVYTGFIYEGPLLPRVLSSKLGLNQPTLK
jgi:dihydroorotate dehydrogenase